MLLTLLGSPGARLYYVIGPASGWTAPSAAQVVAGLLGGGGPATAAGNMAAPTSTSTVDFPATTGLSAGVTYRAAAVWSNGTASSGVVETEWTQQTISGNVGAAAAAGTTGQVGVSQTIAGSVGAATAAGTTGNVGVAISITGTVGAATAAGIAGQVSVGSDISIGGSVGAAQAAGVTGAVGVAQTIAGNVGAAVAAGVTGQISLGAAGANPADVWAYQINGVAAGTMLAALHAALARIERIEKFLRNKQITDPITGRMVVYDDDGVTVLAEGDLFEDVDGATRYRGQGADRRERLS